MKKRINIILILAVIGLWGTVIYRAINQYLFSKKNIENITPSRVNFNSKLMTKDTFLLEVIPRDPFLNKKNYSTIPIQKKIFRNNQAIKKNIQILNKKEASIWPVVLYYGYIKGKREIALLNINKKLYRLGINEQKDGLIVRKIYKDSVEVTYNKEKKIFKLNK